MAALAGDGDRAYVSDASGLVEIAGPGRTQVVAVAEIAWCTVDARARVVWFTDDTGLQTFDLVDRRSHRIIDGEVRNFELVLDWGNQKVGGESAVDFQVGVVLKLAGTPALSTVLGCDGDGAVYCFGDDGKTPTPALAAKQRAASALGFADPAYIRTLVARGARGSLWTPPPMPPAMPARKPTVDVAQCTADPAACGRLTAIPASPLWLVVTANSRGDYFHETRELWDPATGEYVHRDGARMVRTQAPTLDNNLDYGGLRVAAAGMSYEGAVFDPSTVAYAARKGDGVPRSCGWASGGWRIAGPRE